QVQRDFADFLPEEYAGCTLPGIEGEHRPFQPPSGPRGLISGSVELETPVDRHINSDLSYSMGAVPLFAEASEGRAREVELDLAMRPTTQLRGDLSVAWQRLTRAADGSEFARTVIPRARVEYQPTRALFFRMVGEYQAERRAAPRDP